GARSGTQIGCRVDVRADRSGKTAAKIGGTANLFLRTVLSLFGNGTSTGRRPQHRRLADDPRSGQLGSGTEPSSMGNFARSCRLTVGYGHGRWLASRLWRIF